MLSLKDLLVVSRDISARMQKILKVKKVDFAQPAVSNLVTRSKRDSLIHIEMKHRETPIDFIVDTGSELNIISDEVYGKLQNCPINQQRLSQ